AQACALCAVALPCVRRSPRSTPFPYTTLFRSVAFGRAVPKEDILRAVALLFCGLSVLALGTTALLALEPERPLAAIFEAASAFSTTGMTLGLTSKVSPASRLVVMLLMIVGRLGPLTLLAAFFDRRRPAEVHYPAQHVQFG